MLEEVIALLKAEVPALKSRVEGALQLASLLQNNALPQATPAAFVIPAGISGGASEVITGLYRQSYSQSLAVVLVLRDRDSPKGQRALDPLDELCWQVITALAGREMGDASDVLSLRRAFLASMSEGAVVFQIEFSLSDHMRIDR